MEQEDIDTIEWLRLLGLPDSEFRRHVRPYFDDTTEMEQYIETRREDFAYMEDSYVSAPVQEGRVHVPTAPAPVMKPKRQRYKGKRRK